MVCIKWNKRKYLHKFATWGKSGYVAHVIKARACDAIFEGGVGSNLEIFALIFFFCLFFRSSFYFIFFNKKNLFADLNRRTMLVRRAG